MHHVHLFLNRLYLSYLLYKQTCHSNSDEEGWWRWWCLNYRGGEGEGVGEDMVGDLEWKCEERRREE